MSDAIFFFFFAGFFLLIQITLVSKTVRTRTKPQYRMIFIYALLIFNFIFIGEIDLAHPISVSSDGLFGIFPFPVVIEIFVTCALFVVGQEVILWLRNIRTPDYL